jgi:hypothetical protein
MDYEVLAQLTKNALLADVNLKEPVEGDIVVATVSTPELDEEITFAVGAYYKDNKVAFYDDNYNFAPLEIVELLNVIGHSDFMEGMDRSWLVDDLAPEYFSIIQDYFKKRDYGINLFFDEDVEYEEYDEDEMPLAFVIYEGLSIIEIAEANYPILQITSAE